jgi:cyanophycinase
VAGPLALIGGSEFRRESDPVDQALLALTGSPTPAVAILPTGATNEHPEVVSQYGLRHFTRLGAVPAGVMVVDQESANLPAIAGSLSAFGLIYFTDGDPVYLLDTLKGSLFWRAVLAAHQRGAIIAGAGAGAMVLAELMWRVDGWAPGLGLAPGVAVLPHHATLSRRWAVDHMRALLPPAVALVGLDDSTALLLPEARVYGAGQVTLYLPPGPAAYPAGALVPLRPLLD